MICGEKNGESAFLLETLGSAGNSPDFGIELRITAGEVCVFAGAAVREAGRREVTSRRLCGRLS